MRDDTADQISSTHTASLITQVVFLSHLTPVWKDWMLSSITYQSPERLSDRWISFTETVPPWWEGLICKAVLCDWLQKRKRKPDNVGQRRKEVEHAGCLEPKSISVSLHNCRDLAQGRYPPLSWQMIKALHTCQMLRETWALLHCCHSNNCHPCHDPHCVGNL